MTIDLEDNAIALILTAKHLIVSLESSKMIWYLALPPEETIIKGKNKDNIKEEDLNKEKMTQLKNEITRTHEVENGPAWWCVYTKNF